MEDSLLAQDQARLAKFEGDMQPDPEVAAREKALLDHSLRVLEQLPGPDPIEKGYALTSLGRWHYAHDQKADAVEAFTRAGHLYQGLGSEFQVVPEFWLLRLGASGDERIGELKSRFPADRLEIYSRQDGFFRDVWPRFQ